MNNHLWWLGFLVSSSSFASSVEVSHTSTEDASLTTIENQHKAEDLEVSSSLSRFKVVDITTSASLGLIYSPTDYSQAMLDMNESLGASNSVSGGVGASVWVTEQLQTSFYYSETKIDQDSSEVLNSNFDLVLIPAVDQRKSLSFVLKQLINPKLVAAYSLVLQDIDSRGRAVFLSTEWNGFIQPTGSTLSLAVTGGKEHEVEMPSLYRELRSVELQATYGQEITNQVLAEVDYRLYIEEESRGAETLVYGSDYGEFRLWYLAETYRVGTVCGRYINNIKEARNIYGASLKYEL